MNIPLRVGLVGCGNVAQMMHIPYLTEYEQFELIALADVYEPILEAVGNRYGIQRRYGDWQTMFTQEDIEAVILTHAGSHRDAVIDALDAGKHVFVEKPLAWNLREVQEIALHVEKSDRIVQVGYHKRYDPGYRYARQQVQQMDDIGFARITVLHPPDEMGHSIHRIRRGDGLIKDGHTDVPLWEQQVTGMLEGLAGGDLAPLVDEALGNRKENTTLRLAYGILTISIIHQIYTLFGFLGKPERVLSTDIWREGLSIHSILAYSDNLRVSIDWHFLSHLKDYREQYAFYGNRKRVHFHLPSPYFRNFPSPVIIQGGEGELSWEKKVIVSYDEAFRNELLAFYANVQQGKEPETNVREAVQHAEIIQKMIDVARVE